MCNSCDNGFAMKDNCKDRSESNVSDDQTLRGRLMEHPMESSLRGRLLDDPLDSSLRGRLQDVPLDSSLRGRLQDVPLESTLRRTSTLDEIHSSSNLQKLLEIQQAVVPKAKQAEAPRRKISEIIFSTWFFRKPDKTPRYEEDECIVFTALPSSSTSSLATNTEASPSLASLPVVLQPQVLEEDSTQVVRERSRTISEGISPVRPQQDDRSKNSATLSITSIVGSQFSGFNVRELNVLAPQST